MGQALSRLARSGRLMRICDEGCGSLVPSPASFDQSPPENSELALVPLRESFHDCQRRLKMSHIGGR